jgi:arsenate reductase
MDKMTMYILPTCSTCRSAKKWLTQHGYELNELSITEAPPTPTTMKELITLSGEPVKKFFNVNGQVYRELNLKERLPLMSEQEQIEALCSNGMLIKRPLATNGQKVTIGFNDNMFAEVWG